MIPKPPAYVQTCVTFHVTVCGSFARMSGTDAPNSRAARPFRDIAYLLYADGPAMHPVYAEVRSFVRERVTPGCRVLDFGSGAAPYRRMFEAAGAQYVTADIEGTADMHIVPGAPLPADAGSFDFVVSFQVLEHVRDVPLYLREARRVLRPGGRLLLSTHGVWPFHPHPTDFWRWTSHGLRAQVEEGGFVIDRMTPVCGPGAWLPMFPLLVGQGILGRAALLLAPLNLAVNLVGLLVDSPTPRVVRENNASIYVLDGRVP
jgi:SAM-dependent methyltransferase